MQITNNMLKYILSIIQFYIKSYFESDLLCVRTNVAINIQEICFPLLCSLTMNIAQRISTVVRDASKTEFSN